MIIASLLLIPPIMSKLLNREIFHKDGDILNVMSLTFSKGLCGMPHFNKDRDEVLFVEKGALQLLLFDGELNEIERIELSRLDSDCKLWFRIPKNTIHQFDILVDNTVVIEVLGGEFFSGACVNVQL